MVKLYQVNENGEVTEKYINISYFSLLKAYVLSWLGFMGILWGSIIGLYLLFEILDFLLEVV